jgi:hypothetical protein
MSVFIFDTANVMECNHSIAGFFFVCRVSRNTGLEANVIHVRS